jgi:hypothetical protein
MITFSQIDDPGINPPQAPNVPQRRSGRSRFREEQKAMDLCRRLSIETSYSKSHPTIQVGKLYARPNHFIQ